MKRKIFVPIVGAVAAAATLAACGSNGSGGGGSSSGTVNKNATVVLGTTDSFLSLDPAYDTTWAARRSSTTSTRTS